MVELAVAQGLMVLGFRGTLDESVALWQRVEKLKYQVGAIKVGLGKHRLRTSISWYPCLLRTQMISVGVPGSMTILSLM